MARRLPVGRLYSSRSPHVTVLNTTLDRQADQVLRALCPPGMTLGAFITALAFDHRAREEERERLRRVQAREVVPPPDYDTTRYYLGKLCPRGHRYQGTAQSLRRTSHHDCLACKRLSGRRGTRLLEEATGLT